MVHRKLTDLYKVITANSTGGIEMLRMFFISLAVCAGMALSVPAYAGNRDGCTKDPCTVLHKGHVRGRLPIACVSIPFIKRRYGQVALFVMRDFNPNDTPAGIEEQLKQALFKDSKITGRIDDFCRNPKKFAGGNWVVLCDEDRIGWITGESLQYAIRNGRPPGNRRVHIGSGL